MTATHPYYSNGSTDFENGHMNAKLAFTWAMTHNGGIRMDSKVPTYQQTFAMVNSLHATNTADKLSVTLNVGLTGLYLKKKEDLSASEVAWMATIIALAARDAAPLVSTGPSILSQSIRPIGGKSQAATAWACVPELDRFARVEDFISNKDLPIVISEEGLELRILRIGLSTQICVLEYLIVLRAEAAINWLCTFEQQAYTFFHTPLRRRHMIQALGLLLTGGIDWTIACAATVRLHPTDPLRYRWLAENRNEIEEGFRAINAITLDVSGSIPAISLIDTVEKVDGVKALVIIANGLVRTVIGEEIEYQFGMVSETNELQVCVSNTEAHGDIVIFAPPASKMPYELVCPEVLRKKDGFNKSTRKGWVVQANTLTVRNSYRLVCKTALFIIGVKYQ
jgi:hypothetical protein